ncbi:hypothetical protein CHS0354_040416 [Potamilus streckersoni]|uniref:Uncharacterized protein n=1 Tax=Potamilus streckersoni TaxID=2493646 RepID=A0AAE0SZV1_9BIVA|nr:hypothetical protein CHS0354_040416 [Potamilus streckersoni]
MSVHTFSHIHFFSFRSKKMTFLSSLFIWSIVFVVGEATPVSPEDTSKYVCCGESIQLYENIVIDSINMVASLSVSASQSRLIAMWTLQNATIADGYSKKVFRDHYGDIWIRNVSSSDEAHYTLVYQIGIRFVTLRVHLHVLTAPTLICKPKIKRVDDILSASLEASNCGNLNASAYWLKYPGIHYEGKDMVKLSPRNKAGTYYACIEGPALRCARTSKFSDFCSDITIEDNSAISSKSGTECSISTYSLVMPAIILALIFLGVLLLFTHRRIAIITLCRRPKSEFILSLIQWY